MDTACVSDVNMTVTPPVADATVRLLRGMVDEALHEFQASEQELRMLQAEMDRFITGYYARVGEKFETLALLRNELELETASEQDVPPLHFSSDEMIEDYAVVEKSIKSLYRSLVKQCHPDTSPYANKERGVALLREINPKNARQSLKSLWEAQKQFPIDFLPEMYVEQLSECYESITHCVMRVRGQITRVKESPTYALQERILKAEREGIDLVAGILAQADEQIGDYTRQLLRAKLSSMSTLRQEIANWAA